jgi:hypothetical protein
MYQRTRLVPVKKMFSIRLVGEPDAERSGEHHGDLHDGDR